MAVASSSSSSSHHHHGHEDSDSHGGDVSFQEALMCLPQYLREEAANCFSTHDDDTKIKECVKQPRYRRQRASTQPNIIRVEPSKRISGVPQYRRKKSTEMNAAGGPRITMHSFFRDSGRRTISGTGVFLPKTYTTMSGQPSKKPAGFGEGKKNLSGDGNGNKCIMEKEASGKCCLNISPDTSFSAEMFLPQEWTY